MSLNLPGGSTLQCGVEQGLLSWLTNVVDPPIITVLSNTRNLFITILPAGLPEITSQWPNLLRLLVPFLPLKAETDNKC